jgi:hypothetical protein
MNKEAHVSSKKRSTEFCWKTAWKLNDFGDLTRLFHANLVTLCEKLQRNRIMNSELEGMWKEAVLSSFRVPKHDSFEY